MLINKEQYREFNWGRLVFNAEGFGGAVESHDTAKGKPDNEKKDEVPKDESKEIGEIRTKTEAYLRAVIGAVTKANKPGARELTNKLRTHVNARFNRISAEYSAQLKAVGKDTFKEKPYIDRAAKVLKRIKDRLDKGRNYERYSEHQTRQDQIDQANKEAKEAKTPKERREAEAKVQEVKKKIVISYLDQAEATKNLKPAMKKTLAHFIVEGNLISSHLERVDADAYSNDLEAFFKDVDSFNKEIAKTLEGKVKNIVDRFLEEMPNPNENPDEVNEVKKIILADKELKKKFGADPSNAYITKAATAIARKFDIRFNEKEEVIYATDLTTRPRITVHNATQFEASVKEELYSFSGNEGLDTYTAKVETDTEWLRSRRKTIDEGDNFWNGGNITGWNEWKGHEEAEFLMKINNQVRKRSKNIEGTQDTEVVKEREAAQREKLKDAYVKVIKNADLHLAIVEATTEESGYKVTDGKQPEKEPFEGYEVIENAKENIRIRIDLNTEHKITVSITPIEKHKDPKNLNVKYSNLSPEQFKKKAGDLVKLGKETKENWVNNNKEVGRIGNACTEANKGLKKKGVEIKYDGGDAGERHKSDYKTPNKPTLWKDGHRVGHLEFHPVPKEVKGNPNKKATVTIHIDGVQPQKADVNRLADTLGNWQNVPRMKKVADRAKVNMEGVDKQLEVDLKKELPMLKKDANPLFTREKETKGNFSNSSELIQVGTFNKKDKTHTLAATLYITAGAPEAKKGAKAKPRTYELREPGKKPGIKFNSIEDVQKHIEANQPRLAEIPQKPKGKEKTKEKSKEVVKLNKADQRKISEAIINQSEITDKEIKKEILKLVPELRITKEQLKDVKDPNAELELSTAQLKAIMGKVVPKLRKYDDERGKMIHDQLTNDADEDEDISSAAADIIENLFDDKDDPLRQYLVHRYDFTARSKGGLSLTDDNGKTVHIENVRGLTDYLPPSAQENFKQLLDSKNPSDNFEKRLGEAGEKGLKTLQGMEQLGEILRNPGKIKGFEGMKKGDILTTLIQLYALFKEAMESQDFGSLIDGLNDFKNGLNPMDHIKAVTLIYKDGIDKIKDTGDLIDLYNNPKSAKADKLFTEKAPDGKKIPATYRIKLKHVIKERLQSDLGVTIDKMKTESTSKTVIDCTSETGTYKITLEQRGGQTLVTKKKMETREDDGSLHLVKTDVTNRKVQNTTGGTGSLAYVLFKMEGKPEETEAKKEKEKEKVDYKKLDQADADIRKAIDDKNSEGKAQAKTAWEAGYKLRKARKYEAALPNFQKSDKIYPSYATKYAIAECLDKMSDKTGDKKKAITYYNRFIKADMSAKDQKYYEENIENAKKRIAVLEAEQKAATNQDNA